MPLSLYGIVIVLALGACSEELDVGSALSATPFRLVSGVALGMSADELERVRPAAVFNPYRGFRESVRDMEVAYDLAAGAAHQTSFDRGARVESIMLARATASRAEARAQWRAAVDSATASFGVPLRCEVIHGSSAGVRAMWVVDGMFLDVSAREPLDTGAETIPNRVVFVVTRAEQRNRLMEVSEVPCSTISELRPAH